MVKKSQFLLLTAIYAFIVLPLSPVWAQGLSFPADVDHTAPIIQHEPSAAPFPAGEPLVFEATITDDMGVKEATLFYRPQGGSDYASIHMNAIGQDRYTAAVPQDQVSEPGLEYYIQASDEAGNMVMRGFSFSPLMAIVELGAPGMEEAEKGLAAASPEEGPFKLATEEPPTKPWYKKWWVWTLVGAVVIGGAAAAAGGGGGGGGGGDSAGAPPSGSATVSGPLP